MTEVFILIGAFLLINVLAALPERILNRKILWIRLLPFVCYMLFILLDSYCNLLLQKPFEPINYVVVALIALWGYMTINTYYRQIIIDEILKQEQERKEKEELYRHR